MGSADESLLVRTKTAAASEVVASSSEGGRAIAIFGEQRKGEGIHIHTVSICLKNIPNTDTKQTTETTDKKMYPLFLIEQKGIL